MKQKVSHGNSAQNGAHVDAALPATRKFHTLFGVAELPMTDTVFVSLRGKYVEKPVADVRTGENILFAKEGIPGITLDMAHDAMLKSKRAQRYRFAGSKLFHEMKDGSFVTSFSHAIYCGMAQAAELWPESIGKDASIRAVLDGNPIELTTLQQCDAAHHIQEMLLLGSNAAARDMELANSWLEGNKLAERGRDGVFVILPDSRPQIVKALLDGRQEDAQGAMAHEEIVAAQLRNLSARARLDVVTVPHIMNGWLASGVVAPRSRNAVFSLLSGIAPDLKGLMREAFGTAYRDYLVSRQKIVDAVSSELAQRQQTDGDGVNAAGVAVCAAKSRNRKAHDGLLEEDVAAILEYFLTDIRAAHAAATVLRIDEPAPAKKRQAGNGARAADECCAKGEAEKQPVLFKGVVTDKSGVKMDGVQIMSIQQIMAEINIVETMTERVIFEFIKNVDRGITPSPEIMTLVRPIGSAVEGSLGFEERQKTVFSRSISQFKAAGIRDVDKYIPGFDDILTDHAKSVAKTFIELMRLGNVDEHFKCPKGTVERLFGYQGMLHSVKPFEVTYEQNIARLMLIKKLWVDSEKAEGRRAVLDIEKERKEMRKVRERLREIGYYPLTIPESAIVLVSEHPQLAAAIYEGNLSPYEALRMVPPEKGMPTLTELQGADGFYIRLIRDLGFSPLEHLYVKTNQKRMVFSV